MSPLRQTSAREMEALSSYIDGRLSPAEAAALERRLQADAALRQVLEEMRQTVQALTSLPSRPVPRSFALSPAMVGKPAPARWYPVLQLGTALAGVAFLLVVGLDAWTQSQLGLASRMVSAEAPMAQQEAGAESLFAAAGTATPQATSMAAADMLTAQATPAPTTVPSPQELAPPALGESKASPTATPSPTEVGQDFRTFAIPEAPRSPSWERVAEIALGLLTVALAALTLRSRRRAGP